MVQNEGALAPPLLFYLEIKNQLFHYSRENYLSWDDKMITWAKACFVLSLILLILEVQHTLVSLSFTTTCTSCPTAAEENTICAW